VQLHVTRALTDPLQLHVGFNASDTSVIVVRQPGITVFAEAPDRVMTQLAVVGTLLAILIIMAWHAVTPST
jgi:hypothetical protein